MLNYIWFGMMAIALVVAAINGTAEQVTKGAIDGAKTAVEISIGLIGVMTLWMGIMRIAERGGMVTFLARLLAPVLKWIFPEVPNDHPAMGAIVMNLAANMLGLSNAATPLGIKAMEELQELNPQKDTASNAMVMFMALNTANVQFIPTTVLAIMVAAGSHQPTIIIGTTLAATAVGTVAAIIATKVMQPFFPYPAPESPAEVVE
jgi:spore maturation protein A